MIGQLVNMATLNWLYISQLSGNSGTTVITVSAGTNDNIYERMTLLNISTKNTNMDDVVVINEKTKKNCLTFEIVSAGTITWNGTENTIEYSKDFGDSWNSIAPTSTINTNVGDIIYFRGNNNNYRGNNFNGTAKFKVYGNIMSLIDANNYEQLDTLTTDYTFTGLFLGSKATESENLILPATTITSNCYQNMFSGCTELTTAPSILPATTLATSCYEHMFRYCTSLISAPELPATTLAGYCYEGMLQFCTSLTGVPSDYLPAINLSGKTSCYSHMFYGCTSLTTAPELPATTLAQNCYGFMFYGCTSLTSAPELPATTLVGSSYLCMFEGCTSLTSAPELPATTLDGGCYERMFRNCTSLTTAPELPATTLAQTCYSSMFEGCTSLTSAPELPATTLEGYCYTNMFKGCSSLTTAPDLLAKTISAYGYRGMFSGCSSLNYIKCLATENVNDDTSNWVAGVAPSGTFVRASGIDDWEIDSVNGIPIGWTNKYLEQYLTFEILTAGTITWIKSNIFASDRTIEYSKDNGSTWTSITSSRDGVSFSVNSGDKVQFRGTNAHFATSNVNYSYFQTTCWFKVSGNIMSLLYGDNFASQNTLQSGSTFCCLFVNNTRLSDAEFLELPATAIKDSCYEGLFSGCTFLTKAPAKLPSTAMEYECYENMFGGCILINTAPILPATSLSNSCYSGMFDGCSSLNYIKALFTTTPSTTYTSNWVRNVASSGTFVKNRSASWSTTGNNGVPTDWTIIRQ